MAKMSNMGRKAKDKNVENVNEVVNEIDPSAIWEEYADFFSSFGRIMKITHIRKTKSKSPFTIDELSEMNNKVRAKLDELMNSINKKDDSTE